VFNKKSSILCLSSLELELPKFEKAEFNDAIYRSIDFSNNRKKEIRIFLQIVFTLTTFLFSSSLYSQDYSNVFAEDIIESYIEVISELSDEELDYTSIYEDLSYYIYSPLNINTAQYSDLEKLYILSDFQIKSILAYRDEYGNFYSIYELIYLLGFNALTVKLISPFITLKTEDSANDFSTKRALQYGKHNIFIRYQQVLEEQKGYSDISPEALELNPNARYLGSPLKLYTRYKFNYKTNLYWGITAEKDAGEQFFKGERKDGFDYYSAHFFVRDVGKIKALALGDYHVQFGQGLVAYSGFSYGKSPMVLDIRKRARGLKPYGGTDENLFFRGAGTTIKHNNIEFTVFGSHKKIDANISFIDTTSDNLIEVSSLQTTGFHRTYNELDKRKVLSETIFGTNISLNKTYYKIGFTALQYSFDADLIKRPTLYNQFDFTGNKNSNLGFDYHFLFQNISFFGEAAISENLAKAFINGAMFSLSSQMNISILHRYYERDYKSLYSNAFGENTRVVNEKGFYIGSVIYPANKLKLSAYYDMFAFPWLKFAVNAPSKGSDYFIQADYSYSRYFNFYLRFKQKVKPLNISSKEHIGSSIKGLEDVDLTKIRLHFTYSITRSIECRNRLEWVNYSRTHIKSNGFMIYHDFLYRPNNSKYNYSIRYAVFDTDSWDSRIYAYENDILYAFSIPAYYDKGSRIYFNVKYSIKNNIDFWFRIAQTYYIYRETIGTGLEEINGKTRTEVKAQLRFRF